MTDDPRKPVDYSNPKLEPPAPDGLRQVFVTVIGIIGFTIVMAIVFGVPLLAGWLLWHSLVR